MRTLRRFCLAVAIGAAAQGMAQWETFGNSVAVGDYLGADATSVAPLHLRTIPDLSIDFSTSDLLRARLCPVQTSTIGSFQNVNQHGFLGLSGHANFLNGVGPFTRLHLADNSGAAIINAQQFAFRPWQRNGITFTGNADHGYIGQKHNGTDTTDMVIQWSNDSGLGQFAPDHLTFRFATRNDVTRQTGAFSLEGLEAMRMYPLNDSSAHVGVGDFWRATFNNGGSIVEPSERLDVLDGRLRIRQLPDDPETDQAYKVMVVDDTNDPNERGVVKWRNVNLNADCDWVEQDQFPNTPSHVSNTYNGSNCPWDRRHGVGIGIQLPKFKLHVVHNSDALLAPDAIYGESSFNYEQGQWITGVHGRASTATAQGPLLTMRAFGVRGSAFDARSSVGVYGLADITGAQGGGNATQTYGVMGRAVANGNSDFVVGVHGYAAGATNATDDWAGWFDGQVYSPYGQWSMSDGDLKQDVAALEDASSVLQQLQPKTYSFNHDAYGHLGLQPGLHMGLIAEDIGLIMPHAVRDVHRPAEVDSTGEVVHEALDFTAVNYQEFIPLLIAGWKEQQVAISGLQQHVSDLYEQLAACCAAPADSDHRSGLIGTGADEVSHEPAQERLLRIAPNPFTDRTTLYCTLERAGRMQLMANSADGRDLMVLSEGQHEAGEFQYVWSTENLAPGVYYITLLLDGEPVVKRAVKVGR